MNGFPPESAPQPPIVSVAQSAVLPSEPPKKTIKELAAEHGDLCIQILAGILERGSDGESKPASDMAKLKAVELLLDRGFGKATQYVEQTTKVLTYQDLLSEIATTEQKFANVVDAQSVKVLEVPAESPPLLTWEEMFS